MWYICFFCMYRRIHNTSCIYIELITVLRDSESHVFIDRDCVWTLKTKVKLKTVGRYNNNGRKK